jgi:hypothetical protein
VAGKTILQKDSGRNQREVRGDSGHRSHCDIVAAFGPNKVDRKPKPAAGQVNLYGGNYQCSDESGLLRWHEEFINELPHLVVQLQKNAVL